MAGTGPLAAQHKLTPEVSKLAPTVRATGSGKQTVRVSVVNRAAFREWARQTLPGTRVQDEPSQPDLVLVAGLTKAQLEVLLASPLVQFVDAPNRPAHEERRLDRANPVVNGVAAVHRQYPALTGQGLTVSVKENLFDPTDIDFKGRIVDVTASSAPVSEHASVMASLIAGGGNSAPSGKGAAWQARLTPADYANLLPDNLTDLNRRGVSVQNHSYGTGLENYYGLESRAYDAQARQNPALLHVFSSGNSGNLAPDTGRYEGLSAVANLTGQFKMSKNTLSVGATDAQGVVALLSSRGPAYDGRVKPELVAFGDDGSSDAAALVSGISLLAQQAYRNLNGGALPPSSLVKAALLNSADDTGRPEVNFESGFGQVDALGTVRTILDGRYQTGTVGQGQRERFQIMPPLDARKLKVTLVWTDPEAAANASQALVNDLDLEVFMVDYRSIRTVRYLPWTLSAYPNLDSLRLPARRRADHINNVEQVTVATEDSVYYMVIVRGFNVTAGPQAFSVAYEFEQEFEWLAPLTTRSFQAGATEQIRWQWAGPATTARLEYKPLSATSWQLITPSLDLSQGSYAWQVPDIAAPVQLRLVTADTTYVSDTVAVTRALELQVGYACAEEGLLYWNRVPGATAYQVYRLGATHLQPFQITTDTTLVLSKAQQDIASQYAVEPVLGPVRGTRSITLDLANTGLNCYIRSFVPRQVVADTVQLQLELGSTFRLQSVELQRREQGEFQPIQTIRSAFTLSTTFTDLTAATGRNEYRVRLQDTNGRVFYSQTEAAYLVRPNDLLVFPVPVVVGEPLRVVGEPGVPLHLHLFDSLGRLVRETTVEGTINDFDTNGLRAGVYMLRARTATGATITRRIVLL
ncbi:S8 family serine peptidase [Hymenobacter sp. BT186]|uniref:S8 family serine peptidase n=2 Tax=Hymenobacter telluris TaxID=2816474 RepID=A0A939JG00_9BACT|nr:S8 family serine peptidase [Hymenobacter telluris]MBW3377000.1 S8 family serine peptidase [Hymenobacter norwichensis]